MKKKKRTRKTPDQLKDNGTLYLRNIDTELKNQFRAYCIKRRISMTEAIENFMRSITEGSYALPRNSKTA